MYAQNKRRPKKLPKQKQKGKKSFGWDFGKDEALMQSSEPDVMFLKARILGSSDNEQKLT